LEVVDVFLLLASAIFVDAEKGVLNIKPWMLESTTFNGVVVDEKDKPVANATVFSQFDDMRPKTITNAAGEFAITIPPGRAGIQHIVAFANGGARMSTPLLLRDQVGKKLTLKLKTAKAVNIKIVDKDGNSVPNAIMVVRCRWAGVMMPQTAGDDGTKALWIPAEDWISTIAAYKAGVGLDYRNFERENEHRSSNATRLKQPGAEPIVFTLDGATSSKVLLKEPSGKPVGGAKVQLRHLTKRNRGDDMLNLFGFDDFTRTSNAEGVVNFHVLPADCVRAPFFDAHSETHSRKVNRFGYEDSNSPIREIVMVPRVELSGVVRDAEGKPAANAFVRIDGVDFRPGWVRSAIVKADANGRFRCMALPNDFYHFMAARDRFASTVLSKVVNEQSIADVELRMFPATRLFGKAGSARGTQADGRGVFMLRQRVPEYRDLPVEQKTLPQVPFTQSLNMSASSEIDKDGNYEMWVGPGVYVYDVDPYERKEIAVTVNGQTEIRQDFPTRAPPQRLKLEGRVVLERDPTKPVSAATVKGYMPRAGARHLFISGTPFTGEDGKFFLTRDAGDGIVEARTHDGKLAGTSTFKGEQKAVVIRVGPTVTVKGRVLDSDGKPMPKFEIQWSRIVERFMSGGTFSGRETTNEKGEFEIRGLIPGQEYTILGAIKQRDDEQPQSYRRLIEFNPSVPGVFDAGDLKMP
jgi:hypothetical protein